MKNSVFFENKILLKKFNLYKKIFFTLNKIILCKLYVFYIKLFLKNIIEDFL